MEKPSSPKECVALAQHRGDDRIGLRIPEARREIEVVGIEGDIDARAFARRAEFVRYHDVKILNEGRFLPSGVVEYAVEDRRRVHANGTDGLTRRLGGLGSGCGCGCGYREAQSGCQKRSRLHELLPLRAPPNMIVCSSDRPH
jgi:hypothetical protein